MEAENSIKKIAQIYDLSTSQENGVDSISSKQTKKRGKSTRNVKNH